jgi:hypothetical protein
MQQKRRTLKNRCSCLQKNTQLCRKPVCSQKSPVTLISSAACKLPAHFGVITLRSDSISLYIFVVSWIFCAQIKNLARNSVTDTSSWTAGTRMTLTCLFQIWPYKTALETRSEVPHGWHCIMVAGLGGKYRQHKD